MKTAIIATIMIVPRGVVGWCMGALLDVWSMASGAQGPCRPAAARAASAPRSAVRR